MRKSIYTAQFLIGILLITIFGCNSPKASKTTISQGSWKMTLALTEEAELPFTFDLIEEAANYKVIIKNSTERIEVNDVEVKNDSFFMRMPIFDSEFHGKINEGKEIVGLWSNFSRGKDYKIPFKATFGDLPRFQAASTESAEIAPTWEAVFSPDVEEDRYPAIGNFVQNGSSITGTFLTETGDYRFLEGIVDGNTLKMSCFDGAHAFLFTADLDEEGKLSGDFLSGNHWAEPWIASPNPDAEIRAADELTYLKEGYNKVEFTFPNLEGKDVSLSDPLYQDKVVIVQIMGSWCPNCMDETKLYSKWYQQYKNEGLEIIGVAFERSPDMETAAKNLDRLKKHFKVDYEYVIASIENDKGKAAEKLPMLNHVMSFPTSIFIDREGKVRKIHTGFNGPGTGEPYQRFVDEYTLFIERLLREGDGEDVAVR